MTKNIWQLTTINRHPIYIYLQVDSDDDRIPDEKFIDDLAKKLPQGTDKTPEVLETALQGVSPR